MRASSVSIASVLALLASGGVDGFTSSVKAPGSRWVRGAAQRRQQQDVGSRRHRSNTVVVSMSPTVPPQLPDVNQNLSGGDFDNWFWGDAHVKGGVEHAVFEGAKSAIVLFDGECNFCNSGVWMMISNSEARNLRFCAQNSEMGVSLLHSFGQDQESLSSIAVLDKDGHLHTRSDALVHIMARMDMPYPLAATVLKTVPVPLRDAAYGFVSRRRHIFGTESLSCRIPEEDEVERFLL